jgi:hypothetical protein
LERKQVNEFILICSLLLSEAQLIEGHLQLVYAIRVENRFAIFMFSLRKNKGGTQFKSGLDKPLVDFKGM